MGLFDSVGNLPIIGEAYNTMKGAPKLPSPTDYAPEGYFGFDRSQGMKGEYTGKGYRRTMNMDKAAYNAILKNLRRKPGFLESDLEAMYQMPAHQLKLSEQANLRRMNQGAAGAGAFGSASRVRGRGEIMAKTSQSMAQSRWSTRAMQAQAALRDRYNQIQLAEGYAKPRIGMMQGEHARRLGWGYNQDSMRMDEYGRQYNQYLADKKYTRELFEKLISKGMSSSNSPAGGSGLMAQGWDQGAHESPTSGFMG
jgi:hypothetical protein